MILTISDKSMRINPEKYNIESIVLFGSHAYREADEFSDIDLLVIVNTFNERDLPLYQRNIATDLRIPSSWVTIYNKKLFKKEASMGGVFFNSVKNYGEILYSRCGFFEKVFSSLKMDTRNRDYFYKVRNRISTMMESYNSGDKSEQDVLIPLAFSIRELCMNILFINGTVEVRKYHCVEKCYSLSNLEIPFTFQEYIALYALKRTLSSREKKDIPPISREYIEKWYGFFKILISQII